MNPARLNPIWKPYRARSIHAGSSSPNRRCRRFAAPRTITPRESPPQWMEPTPRLPRVDDAPLAAGDSPAGRASSAHSSSRRPPEHAHYTLHSLSRAPHRIYSLCSVPSSPRAKKPRRHRRFSPESSSPVNSPATVHLRPILAPEASSRCHKATRASSRRTRRFTEPPHVAFIEHRRPRRGAPPSERPRRRATSR